MCRRFDPGPGHHLIHDMKATFDSRLIEPGMTFIAVKGEKVDGRDFIPQALAKGASRIIEGYEALDAAARDYRRSLKAKVIGITGSAGKTTTKELVKAFLSSIGRVHATAGNFNNHLGLPVTILNCPEEADYLVLEMGTNHPGEIAHLCDIAEPDCGLLTNIGTAHIEFFLTQEGIAREKETLLTRAKEFGLKSWECPPLPPALANVVAAVLPGAHNQVNAAGAFALAQRLGVTEQGAIAALQDFALPGARWRRIEKDGITYIDDTYNANPDAMIAALKTLVASPGTRKIAILGDMFELGAQSAELHAKVFDFAKSLPLTSVIAVGQQSGNCVADAYFNSPADLKPHLSKFLQVGDVVLLKASHSLKLGEFLL